MTMRLNVQDILACRVGRTLRLVRYNSNVPAGFPSPADDYIEDSLDLNEHLIHHPAATFFVHASGNSMVNAGILDGDLLIVDRSLSPQDGDIVIAVLFGELMVKRIRTRLGQLLLEPDNAAYRRLRPRMTPPPGGSNHKTSTTDDSRRARLVIPIRNEPKLLYSADNAFSDPAKFIPYKNARQAGSSIHCLSELGSDVVFWVVVTLAPFVHSSLYEAPCFHVLHPVIRVLPTNPQYLRQSRDADASRTYRGSQRRP
jgi:DNA polymerase V